MVKLENFTFQIHEVLSLIGLVQCVYVLVYMAFRAGDLRQAFWPFIYFLILGLAFFLDFAQRSLNGEGAFYETGRWAAWFAGPLLAVLLIVQVAHINRAIPLRPALGLLLLPAAYLFARFMAARDNECVVATSCPIFGEWLVIAGLAAGGVGMLSLWLQRGILNELRLQPGGEARFWLAMTLLFMNGAFLGAMLLKLTPILTAGQADMIRTIIGLGLVYLAGTSLFRIYPPTIPLVPRHHRPETLSPDDQALVARITELLEMDKVYQEPTYSRSDLARELNAPENAVSRVINIHFHQSFPQLLNERRVADAQRLLRETAAPIKQIAEESGFQSMATFNRVFRDVTGLTPTAYRHKEAEKGQGTVMS